MAQRWPVSDQLLTGVSTPVLPLRGFADRLCSVPEAELNKNKVRRCNSGDSWRVAWTADRHLPDDSAVPAGKWNTLQMHHEQWSKAAHEPHHGRRSSADVLHVTWFGHSTSAATPVFDNKKLKVSMTTNMWLLFACFWPLIWPVWS